MTRLGFELYTLTTKINWVRSTDRMCLRGTLLLLCLCFYPSMYLSLSLRLAGGLTGARIWRVPSFLCRFYPIRTRPLEWTTMRWSLLFTIINEVYIIHFKSPNLFLYLFISILDSTPVSLCLSLSDGQSLCVPPSLSVCLSLLLCLYVYLSIYLSLHITNTMIKDKETNNNNLMRFLKLVHCSNWFPSLQSPFISVFILTTTIFYTFFHFNSVFYFKTNSSAYWSPGSLS